MITRLRQQLLRNLWHWDQDHPRKLDEIVEDFTPTWLRGEVEAELRQMEDDGLVVSGRDALKRVHYMLSTGGKAVCADLKL